MAGRPPTSEAPPFGRKLAELRKQHGLTQAGLAEQLGVSQKTINYYERRTVNPSLELVQRLAGFFDVSPALLLDDAASVVHPKKRPTQLDRAVEKARMLSSKKQQVVAELIETYVRANS